MGGGSKVVKHPNQEGPMKDGRKWGRVGGGARRIRRTDFNVIPNAKRARNEDVVFVLRGRSLETGRLTTEKPITFFFNLFCSRRFEHIKHFTYQPATKNTK